MLFNETMGTKSLFKYPLSGKPWYEKRVPRYGQAARLAEFAIASHPEQVLNTEERNLVREVGREVVRQSGAFIRSQNRRGRPISSEIVVVSPNTPDPRLPDVLYEYQALQIGDALMAFGLSPDQPISVHRGETSVD